MNKKEFSLIQHYLIPVALVMGNMALVHLIYLLAKGEADYYPVVSTFIAVAALAAAIVKPNKYLLLIATFIYSALLITTLIF